jgi:transcriptional regulator with XRE-family HTH domain
MTNDDKSKNYKIRHKNIEAVYTEVGKRIAKARHQQGMSQEVLAAKSDVDRSHIGFIEQGRRKPTIATIFKLSRVLKVSLEDLFKGL